MNAFTWTFLAALLASAGTRLWLATRQIGHVRAHRERVPAAFAESIPLSAHQKAADSAVARVRFGMLDVLLGALILLALTLGGGIDWIADQWARVFDGGGIAHGIALLVSLVALLALLDLPLEIH